MARASKLQAGEVIYVKSGHAVTAHSVSFYAQDSEQAGLLARAQEIENLDKQLRAQALISRRSPQRPGPRRGGLRRRAAAPGARAPRSRRRPEPRA
jgi:hypothetical protein